MSSMIPLVILVILAIPVLLVISLVSLGSKLRDLKLRVERLDQRIFQAERELALVKNATPASPAAPSSVVSAVAQVPQTPTAEEPESSMSPARIPTDAGWLPPTPLLPPRISPAFPPLTTV